MNVSSINLNQGERPLLVQENLPAAESSWSLSSLISTTKMVWSAVHPKVSAYALLGSVCFPCASTVVFSPLSVYHLACMCFGGNRGKQFSNALLCFIISYPLFGQMILWNGVPRPHSTFELQNGRPVLGPDENPIKGIMFKFMFDEFGEDALRDAFRIQFVESAGPSGLKNQREAGPTFIERQ